MSGAFVFRNLFLTREDGSAVPGTPPLTYILNEDGQLSLPVTLLTEEEDGGHETKAYLVCGEEEDGSLKVNTLLIYDELAQCYTSRSLVDLSALTEMRFPVVDRAVTRNAEGAILGFDEWNIVEKTEIRWPAEENYRLRFLEDSLEDDTLYAAFGLTDLQSNRYTSELVKFTGDSGPGTVQLRYADRNRLLTLRNLFCEPVDGQGNVWLSLDVTMHEDNERRCWLDMLVDEDVPAPGEEMMIEESIEQCDTILRNLLSPYHFRVLVARLEGGSYTSIAHELGRNPKSVDNALQRAKKLIFGYLEEHDDLDAWMLEHYFAHIADRKSDDDDASAIA